ncbi:hypothetical protein EXW94_25420 [Enterobacter sp. JMULE2]|uniref:hypothetical protein n=1 Tax=Enterobacter sp. JMULE2 TaxID=2518340 RepID=UPI001575603B|nr:hypothetical protein [Enterobacter sp. JMULE2]NTZ40940.1 hypothetical protein [Enterobacter sp. JMULE2]
MPKITVSKNALNIVLKHQFLRKMEGKTSASREEMVGMLLERADSLMPTRSDRKLPEKGVICFGPENQITHTATVQWPEPDVSANLLEGEGPRLVVVYGEPGSGVTTYIKSMITCGIGSAEVYDHEPGGDPVNIVGALLAFENGGKAVAALGAESYQEAMEAIALYAEPTWQNSPRGRDVMRQCSVQVQ